MNRHLSSENLEQLSILLVDDDAMTLKVIDKVLSNIGFENITHAANGELAMSLLNEQAIDIVLTDIQMPGMNGIELSKQIRCGFSNAKRDLPIIMFTTLSKDATLSAALALDTNGFLTKPIKPLTVVANIIQAISERDFSVQPVDHYSIVNTDLDFLLHNTGTDELGAASESSIQSLSYHQLLPEMVLAKEVRGTNGSLLLAAGFILNQVTINRLGDLKSMVAKNEFYVK